MIKHLMILALCASFASATTFTPFCITDNSGSCSDLYSQMAVQGTSSGNTIEIVYRNLSNGHSSSVAAVYFQAPSQLLSINSVVNSSGVQFVIGGSPANPPAGNTIGFNTSFYVTASNPKPFNGINPGESLRISFNLAPGANGDTVLDAMVIAAHIISYCNDSETLAFKPEQVVPPVPEPGSYALIGLGLCGLYFGRKYRV